jgi:excinuclease ABC subunit C
MEIKNLPNTSGIYLFFNRQKQVIYVGKSKNLKQRVASYFHNNSNDKNRSKEMKRAIRNVKIKQTRNELEALLLEDKMIKKYRPEYNKKQKDYPSYCYLYITKDEFPTLKIVDEQEKVDGELYGHFEDRFKAQKIERLIYSIFKIRQCRDKTPRRKCINYSLNKCLGPCLGKITAPEYNKIIEEIRDFLKGNCEKLFKKIIKRAIKAASEDLEYEKAANLENSKGYLRHFCKKMAFFQNFKNKTLILKSQELSFLFHKGQIAYKFQGEIDEDDIDIFTNDLLSNDDERQILDRANIVYSWLKDHDDTIEYV